MAVSSSTSDVLAGVAQHDASALEGLFKARLDNLEASGLDPKTYSLVNIAALIAADAAPASYVFQVAFALEAGVTPEEILGLLVALNPDRRQCPHRVRRRGDRLRPRHRPRCRRGLRRPPCPSCADARSSGPPPSGAWPTWGPRPEPTGPCRAAGARRPAASTSTGPGPGGTRCRTGQRHHLPSEAAGLAPRLGGTDRRGVHCRAKAQVLGLIGPAVHGRQSERSGRLRIGRRAAEDRSISSQAASTPSKPPTLVSLSGSRSL